MEKKTAPWHQEGKRHVGISLWALLLCSAKQTTCWSQALAIPLLQSIAALRSCTQWESTPAAICSASARGTRISHAGGPRWERAEVCTDSVQRGGRGLWSVGQSTGSCTSYCFLQVLQLSGASVAACLHISSAQLMRCNSSYICSHSESSCKQSSLLPFAWVSNVSVISSCHSLDVWWLANLWLLGDSNGLSAMTLFCSGSCAAERHRRVASQTLI